MAKPKQIKNKKIIFSKLIIKPIVISFLLINISNVNATKYAIIANSKSAISSTPVQIGNSFLKKGSISNNEGIDITPVGNSDKDASKAFYDFTLIFTYSRNTYVLVFFV